MFVKAARKLPDTDGPEVRSLRWEAAINPHVTEFAPRLRWKTEVGEWFALGFEHVTGRHADFSPGSADLAILAKTIHAIQATPCPDTVPRHRAPTPCPDVVRMEPKRALACSTHARL